MISCGRQIDCPEFNSQILDWIPYENNDTIRLFNTSTDSVIILAINELIIEHTTHYMTNLDCGTCDDQIMVNHNETNNHDLQIKINLNENNLMDQSYLIVESYFTEYNSNYFEFKDYTFENKVYDEVRIFEKKELNQIFIKLILAKGFGIVGLVDNENSIWIIQGSRLKNDKSNSVEIINIACG